MEAVDSDQPSSGTTLPQQSAENKVIILFKHVANAPILLKPKFKVSTSKTIASMIELLRKALKIDLSLSVFIYINQTFAPSPDQTIQNLYDCYACDNKLVLYYAITTAWG